MILKKALSLNFLVVWCLRPNATQLLASALAPQFFHCTIYNGIEVFKEDTLISVALHLDKRTMWPVLKAGETLYEEPTDDRIWWAPPPVSRSSYAGGPTRL